MSLMMLLMQKDSIFLRLLKKETGELPELDMDLIDDLSDSYMAGDVTPLTQLAFAIVSEVANAYDEGKLEVIEDMEQANQTAFLIMHPGLGNS